jgi:DNA-binding XRE family transcriptional regulator
MAKNYRELQARMGPERLARNRARAEAMLKEMPLAELRNAHSMTQTRLAELMEVEQSEISRIEKRTDMYVSTLRSYIEAMGGTLRIEARFPDGAVEITQFQMQDTAA